MAFEGTRGRAWCLVIAWSLALAVLSLLSNITSTEQLSGAADTWLTIRLTLSKITNSGTAWAGIGILGGWLVRRPGIAAAAGVVATGIAVYAHAGLGHLAGIYDSGIWASNVEWLIAPVVVGAPLGLIGALARRRSPWGLLARLIVPLGALAEPWVVSMWPWLSQPLTGWPTRIAETVTAVVLTAFGLVLGTRVLARKPRTR